MTVTAVLKYESKLYDWYYIFQFHRVSLSDGCGWLTDKSYPSSTVLNLQIQYAHVLSLPPTVVFTYFRNYLLPAIYNTTIEDCISIKYSKPIFKAVLSMGSCPWVHAFTVGSSKMLWLHSQLSLFVIFQVLTDSDLVLWSCTLSTLSTQWNRTSTAQQQQLLSSATIQL